MQVHILTEYTPGDKQGIPVRILGVYKSEKIVNRTLELIIHSIKKPTSIIVRAGNELRIKDKVTGEEKRFMITTQTII